jgi:hypothetical protein
MIRFLPANILNQTDLDPQQLEWNETLPSLFIKIMSMFYFTRKIFNISFES